MQIRDGQIASELAGRVKLRDTLRSGIEALLGHGLRSLLTILGILIGIAAVILTVGLGEGAQSSVNSAISALGSNLLVVTPGSTTSSSGVRGGLRVGVDAHPGRRRRPRVQAGGAQRLGGRTDALRRSPR